MISKIQRSKTRTIYNVNFHSWPLDWLSHFVQQLQRKLLVEKSTAVVENIRLVIRGEHVQNAIFSKLELSFTELMDRLSVHRLKEEQQLVPFICSLVQAQELKGKVNQLALYKAVHLINVLKEEHAAEMNQPKHSMELKKNLAVLSKEPKSVNTLLTALIDFEQTCQLHIDLQNRIMFPKIIAANYATD